MKNQEYLLLTLGFAFLVAMVNAQTHSCIPDSARKEISNQVKLNKKKLEKEGKIKLNKNAIVFFDWPLQQASNSSYNNYYHITNFVDHDSSAGIEDFNCGSRSYDGHEGTDIALWPFDHNMVQNNQVEVIAAESGTLLAKKDGEFDEHCSFVTGAIANYAIILHSDGSESWYWHMKNGSVTNKAVGDFISKGEVLGVVASSGYSTGPHLHFEVRDINNNTIDPFTGTCNNSVNTSWWNSQKPYYEPTINHIQTNKVPVTIEPCPLLDLINEETNFIAGDKVYFNAFYQDALTNLTQNYKIYRPDGTIWQSWTNQSSTFYTNSYYVWFYTLPSNAMSGTWSFEVTFNGQTLSTEFDITSSLPNLYCVNGGQLSLSLDQIDVSNVIIGNNGNTNAGSTSDLGYYLSTNTNITDSDYLIESSFLTNLAAGATNTRSKTVTPTNINNMPPDGSYYVGMLIDNEDDILEADETDNNDCFFTTEQVIIGCTDPNAHNHSSSANFNNNNCETCTDGIQNGDETGIDCGGVLCGPCCVAEVCNGIDDDCDGIVDFPGCNGWMCSNATELTSSSIVNVDGPNGGQGASQSNAVHSDWFYIDIPTDGTISVNSCLYGQDTRLWLWEGTCGSLNLVASNDDFCLTQPGGQPYASSLSNIPVLAGKRYYIEWDNFWSDNPFTFEFEYFNCSSVISSYPFIEEFESGVGTFINGHNHDVDWITISGHTPSGETGVDQTYSMTDYMYVESSVNGIGYPNKSARLISDCFDLSSLSSPELTFGYNMYGIEMGSLIVSVSTDNGFSWTNELLLSGNQGIGWKKAIVDLTNYNTNTVKIRFEAITGSGYRSDIGVDQFIIKDKCLSTCNSIFDASIANYFQPFDAGIMDFENKGCDDIDFILSSGPTPSTDTGPTNGFPNSGNFIYLEASGANSPNKVAIIESPCIDISGLNEPALYFTHHMYGSEMGFLGVEISNDNGLTWSQLKYFNGDKGNNWLVSFTNLNQYTGTVKIRFTGITGSNYLSDIALDYFWIYETCNDFYNITGNNINVTYEALDYINSSALCTGGLVNYDAGNFIELTSGFEVVIGTEFNAYIDGCGDNGNEPLQNDQESESAKAILSSEKKAIRTNQKD